jgi:hypothetical protein
MISRKIKNEWLSFSELAIGGLVCVFVIMYWVVGEMAHGHLQMEGGYVLLGSLLVLTGALVLWLVVLLFPEPANISTLNNAAADLSSQNSSLTTRNVPVSR